MKCAIIFFSLLIVAAPCSTQELQWYGFVGFSMFDEDIETKVGDGAGFRAGLGLQFSERFGVEAFVDRAPEIRPNTLLANLGVPVGSFDISTVGNTYLSIGGTFTLPFSDKTFGIIKGGLTNYTAKFERFVVGEIDFCALDEDCEGRGTAAFFSGGMIYNLNDSSSLEFSITQYTGDAEALTFNSILRYRF